MRFIWNGNVIIHILVHSKLHSTWIHQPRTFKPLCTIQNEQVYSVILDHLGTPQELINSKGKVVWLAHYQTWGKVEFIDTAQKEVDCPIRFPGQWFDDESGLHYNRFRYYDPQTGQFISSDPIGLIGGLNTYWYAKNPVLWVDVLGLVAMCSNNPQDDLEMSEAKRQLCGVLAAGEKMGKAYFEAGKLGKQAVEGVVNLSLYVGFGIFGKESGNHAREVIKETAIEAKKSTTEFLVKVQEEPIYDVVDEYLVTPYLQVGEETALLFLDGEYAEGGGRMLAAVAVLPSKFVKGNKGSNNGSSTANTQPESKKLPKNNLESSFLGSSEGHEFAAKVTPGGTGTAFVGHGQYVYGSGNVIVPSGTSITLPRENIRILDETGRYIEAGDWDGLAKAASQNPRIAKDIEGMATWLPGSTVPNYRLRAPTNPPLQILQNSTSVNSSTFLVQLLKQNMGCVQWAACTQFTQ